MDRYYCSQALKKAPLRKCGNKARYSLVAFKEEGGTAEPGYACGIHVGNVRDFKNSNNMWLVTTFEPMQRRAPLESVYQVSGMHIDYILEMGQDVYLYGTPEYEAMLLRVRHDIDNPRPDAPPAPPAAPAPPAPPAAPAAPAPPAAPAAPAWRMQLNGWFGRRPALEEAAVPDDWEEPPTIRIEPLVPAMREGEVRECSVCMSEPGVVACSTNRHSMCAECFADYAVSESNNSDFDGELVCCCAKAFGCDSVAFPTIQVIQTIPEGHAKEFLKGVLKAQERKLEMSFKEMALTELRAHGNDGAIERARKHIAEEILTLRCPNPQCKQAFVDFEGCLALQCSRCKHQICGKCFSMFKDAHKHITDGKCKADDKKGLYGDNQYIAELQLKHRKRMLEIYLRSIPRIRNDVLRACETDLKDLGIY